MIKGLLILAAPVFATIHFPPIPEDLTTPFQVRLAVNGLLGKKIYPKQKRYEIEQLTKTCIKPYLLDGIHMKH
jgi:hypothetical protein